MSVKPKSWWVYTATLGDVGATPAPGTIASAIIVPIIWLLYYAGVSLPTYCAITAIATVLSYVIIEKSLSYFKEPDPKAIVLDEWIGMLIAFIGIPVSWTSVLIGFFLFRVLDISKLFGIGLCERLPRAWGILCDDMVAGLMVNIILRFIVPLVCR